MRRLFKDESLAKFTFGAFKEVEAFEAKDAVLFESFPRITNIDWCIYSLKDNKVVSDISIVIKHEDMAGKLSL